MVTMQKVDLNTATREDLIALEGIGPSTADDIIKYRKEHGGFKSIDELDNVRGFGRRQLEKVRDQFVLKEMPAERVTEAAGRITERVSEKARKQVRKGHRAVEEAAETAERRGMTYPVVAMLLLPIALGYIMIDWLFIRKR
jgi:competence protein ComEA